MLAIDSHEAIDLEILLSQSLYVERRNLNQDGLPDLWWVGYGGKRIGIENKQAGEALASLDSVEEQLMREMAGVDYLGLSIRGVVTATSEGHCQVWGQGDNPNIMFKGRVYHTSFKGYRAWVARLQEMGVLVIEVPDLHSLAVSVVAMHENSQKAEGEHKTFARLIPEHYWLTEQDQQRKALALSLMGLRPACGIGEEIALALAGKFPSMATLVNTLEAGADAEVAAIPLRNTSRAGRQRTIGPATVAKLRRTLGL